MSLQNRKKKKVEATNLKTKEHVASIRDIGRGRIVEAKVRKMREIVACVRSALHYTDKKHYTCLTRITLGN